MEAQKKIWPNYVEEIKHDYLLGNATLEEVLIHLMQEHPAYDWRSIPALSERNRLLYKRNRNNPLNNLSAKGLVVQKQT